MAGSNDDTGPMSKSGTIGSVPLALYRSEPPCRLACTGYNSWLHELVAKITIPANVSLHNQVMTTTRKNANYTSSTSMKVVSSVPTFTTREAQRSLKICQVVRGVSCVGRITHFQVFLV